MVTDPQEAARRVRAARAYAGLTRDELARRGPLTYKQLKLVEDGQRKITSREELLALGRICGVPDEFMEVGFLGAQDVYGRIAEALAAIFSGSTAAIVQVAEDLGIDASALGVDLSAVAGADGVVPPPSTAPTDAARAAAARR